jgi:hypothetical protein
MAVRRAAGGMVLANKIAGSLWLYFLLAVGLLLLAQSCSSTRQARETDVTHNTPQVLELPGGEVASFKVQIEVHDGKCVLNYDGPVKGKTATELLAPCEFLRDPAGNIRFQELTNTKQNGGGSYAVIVMIGGPPANEGYSDKYMKNGCASETQTVSLSIRGIALGSHGWKMNLCPTSSFDEKLFTADSRHI